MTPPNKMPANTHSKYSSYLLPLSTLFLFIIFYLLYSTMAAPELDWGDPGEMQLAAWTAGLSHPTGYPLLLMLSWAWSHLLAWVGVEPTRAVTLFSVTAGAATVALMVPMMGALLQRTSILLPSYGKWLIAVAAAFFFGLSEIFWAQAVRAEVYTLNTLFLVLLLWGMWHKGSETRLSWLALLYGIGLSHHRIMMFLAPGILLWLWLERRDVFQMRPMLKLLLLVILPQVVYLYIAWRGSVTAYLHQPLAHGETLTLYDGTLRAFFEHILGTVFAADLGLKEPLGVRLRDVWKEAQNNLIWPSGVLLSSLGAGYFLRRADFLLLLTTTIGTICFGIIYAIGDVEVMYVPAWLLLTVLTFSTLAKALELSKLIGESDSSRKQPSPPQPPSPSGRGGRIPLRFPSPRGRGGWGVRAVFVLLLIILVASQLLSRPRSRAEHHAPRHFVNEILAAEPPENAILITNDRNEMVPLWYAQFAEGKRPDMLALFPLITTAPEHAHVKDLVAWALQWERPLLLTKPMPGLTLRYDMTPYTEPLVIVHGFATLPTTPVLQSDLAPELIVDAWEPPQLQANQQQNVALAIRPIAPIPHDLSFSLQLFNPDGSPITQRDIPPDPFYPSSEWEVHEPLRLLIPITLPAEASPTAIEWRLSSYVLQDEGFLPIGQQIILGRVER